MSSQSPVGADFVAPRWERVPELIDDLVAFSRRTDIGALTTTAIAHAQFETIHPFTDGNGRTGRALAQALLRYRAVTRSVAVPVSAGLLADVDGYHSALTAYRAGDLEPIVAGFAEASLRAVVNARELVSDIDVIASGWRERVRARSRQRIRERFLSQIGEVASAQTVGQAGGLATVTPTGFEPVLPP